ncbi:nuclear transport factor 2 family protein [Leeuwenhoekiella blandensis]|uniref:DUF5017 domain-containing protein n=1 Tax=Leeuwenhoekiella blandensis (strain CECT 7118 / CCUG 51940 / KCTC 22103 / MED217) TaxID=398720 RepID=A3XQC6_LEEBM|nr:hypothetical protein [Leeuwenhoekiella blandensis]EAQ48251.1 hypothetical protein MED217_00595 [Leeuwenhoekiella blandensis MED217]
MKKINYLFTAIAMAFLAIGCDPVEDINERLEANEPGINTVLDYTLTDDDYADLELNFGNFSSMDDARALIPQVLNNNFPVLGEGSLANVTFAIYDPIRVEDYTVVAADYEAVGLSNTYFSGLGEIQDFLDYQYPQAENGDYVSLTYQVLADEIQYTINADDFDLIGEELAAAYPDPASSAAQYSNFDRREERDAYWDNDMILEAINFVLADNFDNVTGQKYNVSYAIYDGSAGTESMTVQFDGNAYVAVGGVSYEFIDDDYTLVGTELAETYPGPAGNLAQYGSFDVRETSSNYWNPSMLLEAYNIVLDARFPDAEEGDKYELTYQIYNGSVSSSVASVVKEGDTFVIDETASVSTIEATTVYAFANNSWNEPFMLESEDYTEMGQSYPNFDDEDEAIYKLEIFLGREFPYAEEGDFVAVAYAFYDGSTSTEYANFIFENGVFVNIPSVIETSLQFGNDGTTWVPDNTIAYTLTPADYDLIVEELGATYPAQTSSMAQYGNLDRRSGNAAFWSDDMILEAMNILLDDIDPSAEEGQKYAVTFDIYNGSNTTETFLLIKTDGVWVLQ